MTIMELDFHLPNGPLPIYPDSTINLAQCYLTQPHGHRLFHFYEFPLHSKDLLGAQNQYPPRLVLRHSGLSLSLHFVIGPEYCIERREWVRIGFV
jgi:hypothetical protein